MTENDRLAPLDIQAENLGRVAAVIKHGDGAVNGKLAPVGGEALHHRGKDAVLHVRETHHAEKRVCLIKGLEKVLGEVRVEVLVNDLGEDSSLVFFKELNVNIIFPRKVAKITGMAQTKTVEGGERGQDAEYLHTFRPNWSAFSLMSTPVISRSLTAGGSID